MGREWRKDKHRGDAQQSVAEGDSAGGGVAYYRGGREIRTEKSNRIWTDYAIQMQVISLVMRLVGEEGGWDGQKYVAEHLYGIDSLVGSMLKRSLTT